MMKIAYIDDHQIFNDEQPEQIGRDENMEENREDKLAPTPQTSGCPWTLYAPFFNFLGISLL